MNLLFFTSNLNLFCAPNSKPLVLLKRNAAAAAHLNVRFNNNDC